MTLNRQRSAFFLSLALLIITIVFTGYSGSLWLQHSSLNLGILVLALSSLIVIAAAAVFLAYRKNADAATWLLMISQSILFIIISVLVSDVAPILAIGELITVALFALLTLRQGRQPAILMVVGVVTGLALLTIDSVLDLAITWQRLAPDTTLTQAMLPAMLTTLTIIGDDPRRQTAKRTGDNDCE